MNVQVNLYVIKHISENKVLNIAFLIHIYYICILIINVNYMGRPFKYTVQQLSELYEQYKIHRSTEFDVRYDYIKSGDRAGETIEIKIPKVRTIASFCHFINVTEKSFFEWLHGNSDNIDPDLIKFITRVQEEIKDYQLSGAVNGVYNPTIVARMNNLSDTVNVESNLQPVINIALPNFAPNFAVLQENNIQDIDYNEVKPLELTELNTDE